MGSGRSAGTDIKEILVNRKKAILLLIIFLTLAFIWGHSVISKDNSARESGWVLKLVSPFLELFLGKGNVTDHIVRKLAHFAEYSVLGAELLCFFSFGGDGNMHFTSVRQYTAALLYTLFTALIDETIQLFSDRGSQVSDIWLDCSSAAFGALAAAAIILLFSGRRGKE